MAMSKRNRKWARPLDCWEVVDHARNVVMWRGEAVSAAAARELCMRCYPLHGPDLPRYWAPERYQTTTGLPS